MKSGLRRHVWLIVVPAVLVLIVASALAWQQRATDPGAGALQGTTQSGSSIVKPVLSESMSPNLMEATDETTTVSQPESSKPAALPGGPLPADGTPWHEMFSSLMERARNGDKAASDRLYDDTFGCMQFSYVMRSARERLRTKGDLDKMSIDQVIRELDGYETMQSVLSANVAVCAEASQEELLEQMYSILRLAAENGNEHAAACFASGPYQPPRPGNNKQAALTAWAGDALRFMKLGVRRGDWRMVLLMRRYHDPGVRMLASSYDPKWQANQFEPDPLVAYRYAALRAFGAKAVGSEKDQLRTSELLSYYEKSFSLSDAQIADARRWAEDMYRQYFVDRPWLPWGTTSFCNHD